MVRYSLRRRIARKEIAQRWGKKAVTAKMNNDGDDAPATEEKVTFSPVRFIVHPFRLMLAEMKSGGVAKRCVIVKTDDENDPQFLERELKFLVGLKHTNIIKVYSVFLFLLLFVCF
jgi:hypothetical protein